MVLIRAHARRRLDDGAVAILVTVVVVAVILPVLAIVVDLGLARLLSQQSQGAADAAALAAASTHPRSLAEAQAAGNATEQVKALTAANLPTLHPNPGEWDQAWATCVDPDPLPSIAGPGSCISFDFTSKRVRVRVPRRTVPTIFSGVLGRGAPAASATTVATWGSDAPAASPCALCVLGNYGGGRKVVTVSGGDAAVGGSLSVSSGGGSLAVTDGGRVTYGGGLSTAGSVSPPPVVGPAPSDPFASSLVAFRTMPNGQSVYGQPSGTAVGSCQPGVYQDVSLCLSFAPGTYYVTGRPSGNSVQVSLNADASGVTLFLTCSATGGPTGVVARACPSGSLPRFIGTVLGSHTLTAPGSGTGLALVFDAGLVRNERLNGNGQLTVNGDVYGPGVTLRDNAGASVAVVNGRVVVQNVSFTSSANPGSTMLRITVPPPGAQLAADGPVRLVPTS